LALPVADFEDALQVMSALTARADLIVTTSLHPVTSSRAHRARGSNRDPQHGQRPPLASFRCHPVGIAPPRAGVKLPFAPASAENRHEREGYVVREARAFGFREFRRVVGEYVRAGQVKTGHARNRQIIVPNGIGEKP
jgi:hypothetical protein